MLKNLNGADEAKNEETVNQVNDVLIDLRNTVNRNVIPKNKNPDKVIDLQNSSTLINGKKEKNLKY